MFEPRFEDPIARCNGVDEVAECFRALKACSPVSTTAPKTIAVHVLLPSDGSAAAGSVAATAGTQRVVQVLQLDQMYFGRLAVSSTLHVHYSSTVTTRPGDGGGDNGNEQEGKGINERAPSQSDAGTLEIVRFEERWNGVPLLWSVPFVISRRINGLLSYTATPVVLRS